jgi:hypothetical protein
LNSRPDRKKIPLKWLIGLLAALVFITLSVGLKPMRFRLSNNVKWIAGRSGIQFGRYGIAYTHPFDDSMEANVFGSDDFSLEIALKPASYQGKRFKFIWSFHDGTDSEQLIMGQWRSWFIVINGDDYAYRRKTKRLTANAADAVSPSPQTRLVTLTTGKDGTRLYFDGKPVSSQKDLTLKIPIHGKVRLLAGNSVYGIHPWRGDIYGLALYNYSLSSQKAALHYNRWSKDRNFSFAREDSPFILYLFDEKAGTIARDHAGGNFHLVIPSQMRIFEHELLALPTIEFISRSGFIKDIVINLFGFMPLGLVLFATLIRLGGAFDKHAILFSVILCFSVSLFIEVVQAWMPSRSSHMLDLVLNTLGGLSGAIIAGFFVRRQML